MRLTALLQNSCKKDNIIVKRLKKLLLTQLTVYFKNDDEQLALLNVSKLRYHRWLYVYAGKYLSGKPTDPSREHE